MYIISASNFFFLLFQIEVYIVPTTEEDKKKLSYNFSVEENWRFERKSIKS